MYPLSLQELGSDNTAYLHLSDNLIIFNLLWSIVKRSKELLKLQCFWDFYILFHKFKESTFFSLVLSLLRTLNLLPEGLRKNVSRLFNRTTPIISFRVGGAKIS